MICTGVASSVANVVRSVSWRRDISVKLRSSAAVSRGPSIWVHLKCYKQGCAVPTEQGTTVAVAQTTAASFGPYTVDVWDRFVGFAQASSQEDCAPGCPLRGHTSKMQIAHPSARTHRSGTESREVICLEG